MLKYYLHSTKNDILVVRNPSLIAETNFQNQFSAFCKIKKLLFFYIIKDRRTKQERERKKLSTYRVVKVFLIFVFSLKYFLRSQESFKDDQKYK